VADDGLHYEEAARVMATCSAAGVASIRLSDPTSLSVPASARPGDGP
jgi:hypothetical protein